MVEAIGAAILTSAFGYAGIGATVAGVSAASIVGYAVVGGATVGLSALLAPDANATKSAPQQITERQAIPPRRYLGGRGKYGGYPCELDVANGVLVRGIIHCSGPVTAIEEFWLSDTLSNIPGGSLGGTNTTPPWVGVINVESHLGEPGQAASSMLQGLLPDKWTPAHRLGGICYSAASYAPVRKSFAERFYPSGPPALRVVIKGSPFFDPRTGATAWSDNAALWLLWYLRHPDGLAMADEDIDFAAFAAAANRCDEAVPLKAGGTEPRYRAWGQWDATEAPAAVLQRVLGICDLDLLPDAQGRVSVQGGGWEEPTFTITPDMVLGWSEWDHGAGALSEFNRLKFSCVSADHDYQPVEGDPWDDTTAIAAAGGRAIARDADLRMAPSFSQGRRIAKIESAKRNPRHRFRGLVTNLGGAGAWGRRLVRMTLPEIGVDTTFRVEKIAIASKLERCVMDLGELTADAYAWSPTTEEGTSPPLPGERNIPVAPTPSGIVWTVERVTVGGTVTGLAVRFTAADPDDDGLNLIGRYRVVGTAPWTDMTDDGPLAVRASPLTDGPSHEAELAWDGGVVVSPWTPAIPFAAVADPTAPAQPTLITVSPAGGVATVRWTASNSPNHASVRVRRANGAGAAYGASAPVGLVYGAPGQEGVFQEGLPAGTYRYWLLAQNGSGVPSTPSGPHDVTI